MPLPTSNDVHVDQMLTNVSIGYKNAAYVADEFFPLVPVNRQSDIIPAYSQSYWFRDEAQLRAPGTARPRAGTPSIRPRRTSATTTRSPSRLTTRRATTRTLRSTSNARPPST